jgi:hypothetical protein
MQRKCEYDEAHNVPGRGHVPRASYIFGLRPFTDRLRAIVWPRNFKLHDLDTYDGKANPEQWIIVYEIAIRAAHGDEDIMTSYLPVVIN